MSFDRTEEVIGYNKRLSYCDTANGSFVEIGGTFEMTPPERELGESEITNDNTPDYTKDYIPGLYEPGEVEFKYKYGATQYATVEGIFMLAAAAGTRASATKYWKLQLPDGSVCAFRGWIKKHAIDGMNLEDALTVTGSIRVIGKATFTPPEEE